MDDTEDDTRYPSNPYSANHQQGYGSSLRQKIPVRGGRYSRPVGSEYDEDIDEDEDLDDEEEENNGENNGFSTMHKDVGDDDEEDDNNEDEDDEEEDEAIDEDNENNKKFSPRTEDVDPERHPKKRKLKSLISSYEFAARLPAPPAVAPSVPKQSFGGRNSLTDWTEQETFILLDAWGDRFLQHGKKSLRIEEWQEVAEKVSEVSKIERTDTQCRNRLDTLKKKYKKEKMKLVETSGFSSKWVYFKKMDVLLSSTQQQAGPSCGLDSGEYVFMNPKVYLTSANGMEEMRDSPGNSNSAEGDDNDSDGLPLKKIKFGRHKSDGSSFRLLADSIQKCSEIYEKIEKSKRQQMLELEKMRMDFYRELEMQKRQIMERAQAEIAKLQQGDDEDNDISSENANG